MLKKYTPLSMMLLVAAISLFAIGCSQNSDRIVSPGTQTYDHTINAGLDQSWSNDVNTDFDYGDVNGDDTTEADNNDVNSGGTTGIDDKGLHDDDVHDANDNIDSDPEG